MNAYEKHREAQIESILNRVRKDDLRNFPATRNRLLEIVKKIQSEKPLSENDIKTIHLNEIDW
jgi:hypothetical protein